MAEVDPRFDPQFQRGYDPARHRPRTSAAPPPRPRAEQPDAPRSEPEQTVAAVDAEVTPTTPDEEEAPRRNPFRLLLLLASIASVAGAALLLWRRIAQDPYGGYGGYGGDIGQVFVQQFTDAAMAPLLTGGVLGFCLWLALGAVRRRS